jgi:phosphate transport system permease protein
MSEPKTFTGVRREKQTRWSVRLADVVSRSLITFGGIGTIAAILLVFVFLAWVAVPMFDSPTIEAEQTTQLAWGEDQLLRVTIDEYRTLGWAIDSGGSLIVFRADNGEIIQRKPLFNDAQMTAVSIAVDGPGVAIGFADGSVRLGKIDFSADVLDLSQQRDDNRKLLEDLPEGGVTPFAGGIAQRMEQGGFRHQKIAIEFDEPVSLGASPVRLVNHYAEDRRTVLCALPDSARARWA